MKNITNKRLLIILACLAAGAAYYHFTPSKPRGAQESSAAAHNPLESAKKLYEQNDYPAAAPIRNTGHIMIKGRLKAKHFQTALYTVYVKRTIESMASLVYLLYHNKQI